MKINNDTFLLAEKNWEKYNQFKETAKQDMLPVLSEFDSKLNPYYEKLQETRSNSYAVVLNIYFRKKVFPTLGID